MIWATIVIVALTMTMIHIVGRTRPGNKNKLETNLLSIDHFTVAGLVTWPLNGGEAGVDFFLIQTSLLLLCKSSCFYAN